MLLGAVVLLGTAVCDEDCATLLCKAKIIHALIELLKGRYRSIFSIVSIDRGSSVNKMNYINNMLLHIVLGKKFRSFRVMKKIKYLTEVSF